MTSAPGVDLTIRNLVIEYASGGYKVRPIDDFNLDAHRRLVFEGIMPLISGASRLFVNDRFAQPSRLPRQHQPRHPLCPNFVPHRKLPCVRANHCELVP